MITHLNQLLVFVLEIAMCAAYVYFGMSRTGSVTQRWGGTLVMVAMAIGLWARFAAPKSVHRLSMPYLALFRGVMFLSAALCYWEADLQKMGLAMAILGITTQIISSFMER